MSSGLEEAFVPSPQQKQLTSTSLQEGRPSVADLRRSFEQTNTGTQRNAHSFETPRYRLDRRSISIRHAAGNSVDRNSRERKDVETEVFKTPSAHRTNKLEAPPGSGEKLGELKPRNTGLTLPGQIPDGESIPTSAIRTPPSLPVSKSSRSHHEMMKSRTLGTPKTLPAKFYTVADDVKRRLPPKIDVHASGIEKGEKYSHSSPYHPLLLCNSDKQDRVKTNGAQRDLNLIFVSKSSQLIPLRRSIDFGTQTDLSFPPETCSASHNFIEHPVEPPFDEDINTARTYHQNQYERFLMRLLEREEISCSTGSNSVVHEVEAPVPTAPTAVESHHPIRRVWRRISSSFAQSLEGGHENSHYRSSYQESSTSFDHSRSPHQRSLFPLLPARKSFAFMQRFSSNGTHNLFGLDGANQSVPDADIFMNPDAAHGTTNLARHPSHTSTTSHNTSLPAQDELRRLAQRDAFRDKQTQKKRDKELAKHERRERRKERRLAKQAGKQTRRTVSRAGSTAEAETSSTKERAWGQQTASGFMVRQARLGSDELQSPKPYRPGQVKKIVNMYKEKSNSLLRIASGHWGNSTEQVKGKGKEKDERTLY
ncbi:uncharacterized protein JN550_007569 [Neoarthrinium moseri]|uniref:uncharacterized protein n=1 Tax=Neoarthrinium moseri TaxID=1658444 RepID=UPI001FDB6D47|nr:uncharacterized protein JN550_007569 [Neoarthrinium moseri]KAI1866716.1 hypothetical protein JN550_007569 [Neoarthrinium moseri]